MEIENLEFIKPTEENEYCAFNSCLENDKNVFFHMTPALNKDSIIANGFRSAKELGIGVLESVSYAPKSSSCFANLGNDLESEYVIFAVRFESDSLAEIVQNGLDILVYKKHLQPKILGIICLPVGFKLS
jgi:hypothetical protein